MKTIRFVMDKRGRGNSVFARAIYDPSWFVVRLTKEQELRFLLERVEKFGMWNWEPSAAEEVEVVTQVC